MKFTISSMLGALLISGCAQAQNTTEQIKEETVRVPLKANMVKAESELADFSGLVDEQDAIGDPPTVAAKTQWQIASQHNKKFPFSAVIDLGARKTLVGAVVLRH